MRIHLKQKFIHRSDLKNNPTVTYLFGDNLIGRGYGGQAHEMRGEPNAIGIPTKLLPQIGEDSFFSDKDYAMNVQAIDHAFSKIPAAGIIISPTDGLGTGLAQLGTRAPKTAEYLNKKMEELDAR